MTQNQNLFLQRMREIAQTQLDLAKSENASVYAISAATLVTLIDAFESEEN